LLEDAERKNCVCERVGEKDRDVYLGF